MTGSTGGRPMDDWMSSGQHPASTKEIVNPIWSGNTFASPGGAGKCCRREECFYRSENNKRGH